MSNGKQNLFWRLKNTKALLAEEQRRNERLRQRIEELEATIATADLDYKIIRENIANERRHIAELESIVEQYAPQHLNAGQGRAR